MQTRKFCELIDAMPSDRRQKIVQRVRETMAAMPLEELLCLSNDAHRAILSVRGEPLASPSLAPRVSIAG